MNLKSMVWVGSFSVIFLFLPSMAIKLWDYLLAAPWEAKRWLFYLLIGLVLVQMVRRKFKKRAALRLMDQENSALDIAKARLAKGEITLDEFRVLREELRS